MDILEYYKRCMRLSSSPVCSRHGQYTSRLSELQYLRYRTKAMYQNQIVWDTRTTGTEGKLRVYGCKNNFQLWL